MERMLSCTFTVVRNILEYLYIWQIAKRRTNPLFAFNMKIRPNTLPDQTEHVHQVRLAQSIRRSVKKIQGCGFESHSG